jgi:hypothetical protein
MIRTIEINDDLDERVESAIDQVKQELVDYLEANKPSLLPDINDLNYNGAIDEIVDSCTPVYTYQIDGLWYLHKFALIEAYDNAGFGDNPMNSNGAAAIYYYIQQEVYSWYSDSAENIFNEWQENQESQVDG